VQHLVVLFSKSIHKVRYIIKDVHEEDKSDLEEEKELGMQLGY